ncbi:unnamed protein product [Rotaria sordida]|uniref:UDP-glucose 4-epimerase n=1 Tax=Rotaria sordida TaxID=392033 RepID=A0A819BVQ2_9BILA|nr:unnamed protein product [Rotaria sordida]
MAATTGDSNKLQVLVPGDIGFIGSHCIIELINAGYEPIVVDNLSNFSIVCLQRVEQIVGCRIINYKIDCLDLEGLRDIFKKHSTYAIMNFAAWKSVDESVEKPVLYYKNNVGYLLNLLTVLFVFFFKPINHDFLTIVYGSPKYLSFDEKHPYIGDSITNPYGKNLIGEGPIGRPNNLMPYVAQVAVGRLLHMNVTGTDHDTPDGTGIRDYIHVVDMTTGHIACMNKFKENSSLQTYL